MQSTTRACTICGAPYETRDMQVFQGRSFTVTFPTCDCEDLKETEFRAGKILQRQEAAGIPERYRQAEHPRALTIASEVEGGQGFYLDGTQGTGKTHLAMAIARILVERDLKVRVTVASTLMEAMRSRTAEDRNATQELMECRVLVLDDLGKESPTAYACERLFDIVNARYNSLRPIIVTSNYTRGELAKRLSEGDAGRSIASRLSEMCKRVHMDGADRRVTHA